MEIVVYEMHLALLSVVMLLTNMAILVITHLLILKTNKHVDIAYDWCLRIDFNKENTSFFKENCLHYKLTSTEMVIAQLLYQGLGNKEIAERTFVSEETVKTHVQRILRKTEAKSRTALVFLLLTTRQN